MKKRLPVASGTCKELLNAYLFTSLHEVRLMSEAWRVDYNEERPHKSLNQLSPIDYLNRWTRNPNHETT
jgi:putative transposase